MSVFSLDSRAGNPVTAPTVQRLCAQLGVSVEPQYEEDYRRLLAVFHDACESLMKMDGMSNMNPAAAGPVFAGYLPRPNGSSTQKTGKSVLT